MQGQDILYIRARARLEKVWISRLLKHSISYISSCFDLLVHATCFAGYKRSTMVIAQDTHFSTSLLVAYAHNSLNQNPALDRSSTTNQELAKQTLKKTTQSFALFSCDHLLSYSHCTIYMRMIQTLCLLTLSSYPSNKLTRSPSLVQGTRKGKQASLTLYS